MNGLYHKDVWFPKAIEKRITGWQESDAVIGLSYGSHAREQSFGDMYGDFNIPKELKLADAVAIEVEIANNLIEKIVWRISHDEVYDMCVVVAMQSCFVKTVWLNEKIDTHKTLNGSKYMRCNKLPSSSG